MKEGVAFITFVGNSRYRSTSYAPTKTEVFFAPTALLKYLEAEEGIRPQRILLLTTKEVLENKGMDYGWYSDRSPGPGCGLTNVEAFKEELELKGLKGYKELVEVVEIEADAGARAVSETFEELKDRLDKCKAEKVIVDITHAFRFLPVVVLSMLRMIEADGGPHLDKVLYAQFEGKEKKIVDLTSFVLLSEYAFAVRVFERYGVGEPIGEVLGRIGKEEGKEGRINEKLEGIGRLLSSFGRYFFLGVRVPLGRIAQEIVAKSDEITRLWEDSEIKAHILPLRGSLEKFLDLARRFSIKRVGDKIVLDDEEIEKELEFVKELLQRGLEEKAMQVMREIMLNKVVLETYYRNLEEYKKGLERCEWGEEIADWLIHTIRDSKGRRVRRIKTMRRKAELFLSGTEGEPEEEIKNLYKDLGNDRNFHAHAGFSKEKESHLDEISQNAWKYFYKLQKLMETDYLWMIQPESSRKLEC